MIPWLLVSDLLSNKGDTLASMVSDRIAKYPSSGEINSRLENPDAAISRVMSAFEAEALEDDRTDGISVSLDGWRFSLRQSNTEPLVRLNVESRGMRH